MPNYKLLCSKKNKNRVILEVNTEKVAEFFFESISKNCNFTCESNRFYELAGLQKGLLMNKRLEIYSKGSLVAELTNSFSSVFCKGGGVEIDRGGSVRKEGRVIFHVEITYEESLPGFIYRWNTESIEDECIIVAMLLRRHASIVKRSLPYLGA